MKFSKLPWASLTALLASGVVMFWAMQSKNQAAKKGHVPRRRTDTI